MALYYSKDGLYREISKLKTFLGLSESDYGFDLVKILSNSGFLLDQIEFQTKGLRGMAIVGCSKGDDVILLNSKRSRDEQNFDCGHEMVHLALHRSLNQKTFNCFDRLQAEQNPFIEWQANEGAAEFFIPHRILIPMIGDCYKSLNTYMDIEYFKTEMSNIFNVPSAVMKYRIENLKYETEQYLCGIPLNDIEILSTRKQAERHINVTSLNGKSDNDFNKRMIAWTNSFTG